MGDNSAVLLRALLRRFDDAWKSGLGFFVVRAADEDGKTTSIGGTEGTPQARGIFHGLALSTEPLLVDLGVGYDATTGDTAEGRLLAWALSRLPPDPLPNWGEPNLCYQENAFSAVAMALEMALADKTAPTHQPPVMPVPTEIADKTLPPTVRPKPEAFQAYMFIQYGHTQQHAAEMLKVTQGTIAKWKKAVEKWTAAGNAIPEISQAEPMHSKPTAMSPEKLELGPRVDHRAAHQTAKLAEISGHGPE